MVFVTVGLHATGDFQYLFIHAHVQISLSSHALEKLPIVAFAVANERSQNVDGFAGIGFEYHFDDLFLRVFDHLFAGCIAVCRSCTCV